MSVNPGEIFQYNISYRQWLIGQAISGLASNTSGPITTQSMALLAISLADAVIYQLYEQDKYTERAANTTSTPNS